MSEIEAQKGLDVVGYSFKWQKAKRYVAETTALTVNTRQYWFRVRVTFLELGGERLDGKRV